MPLAQSYQQVIDPVADSVGVSSIFAVLPLLTLFVLLGGLKLLAGRRAVPAGRHRHRCRRPRVRLYNLTVRTGHVDVLRRSFGKVSADLRIMAVIVAFCSGGLLEALAGFGTRSPSASSRSWVGPGAAEVRGHRAHRQHRAGRLRGAGHAHRHARRRHLRRPARHPGPDRRQPRRHGGSPDPAARRDRPAADGLRRRRPTWPAPDLAAGAGRRGQLRHRPVPRLQRRLRPADRHRRLARGRRLRRRAPACLAAGTGHRRRHPRRRRRPGRRPWHRRRYGAGRFARRCSPDDRRSGGGSWLPWGAQAVRAPRARREAPTGRPWTPQAARRGRRPRWRRPPLRPARRCRTGAARSPRPTRPTWSSSPSSRSRTWPGSGRPSPRSRGP